MEAAATRVVVLDDEERTVQVLASWLGNLGFVVHGFTSVENAIEFVSREGADVVLTASHVANMGGAQIAASMRDARRASPPAFVAMTPQGESARGVEPGFDGTVRKPCALDTLLTEISRLAPAHG
ncbi:response regulator [Sandaracinus amylolyticus]|nr:response regulator [Sandaracinus amylolyticus]